MIKEARTLHQKAVDSLVLAWTISTDIVEHGLVHFARGVIDALDDLRDGPLGQDEQGGILLGCVHTWK